MHPGSAASCLKLAGGQVGQQEPLIYECLITWQPGLGLFTQQLKFPRGAKRQVLRHHHFPGLCLHPGYQ